MEQKQELLASLLSITGIDEQEALGFLEASNWKLEDAVNLVMSTQEESKSESEITSSFPEGIVDNIRAPIPKTTEILSEDPTGDHILSYERRNRRRFRGFNPDTPQPIFDLFREEGLRDYKHEGQILEGKAKRDDNPKLQKLADLFRPPVDIICRESLEEAKIMGSESNRWLLVNIQDATEFASQQLNRDTWSHKPLKDVLKTSFIFWQRHHDTEEGIRYSRFYPVETRPHIALLDPRTGELIRKWEGFVNPEELLNQLVHFLSSHSLVDTVPVSFPEETKQKETQEDTKKSLLDCSEEEQLAAVLADSLNETTSKRKLEEEPTQIPAKKAKIPLRDDDPKADCTIQIRESNGNIIRQSFSSQDTVQDLHDFVSSHRTDGKDPFELVTPFPRRALSGPILQQSLAEANLAPRAVIIVQLKTD